MGESYEAVCRDCLHSFEASDGGGFLFLGLHCTVCGEFTTVAHELIPGAREQLQRTISEALGVDLSSAKGPIAFPVDAAKRSRVKEAFLEAVNRFDEAVEAVVGRCSCGGRFSELATVRCPACKSKNIQQTGPSTIYD
jgi:DNA-binding cell septation regulator SpoVG